MCLMCFLPFLGALGLASLGGGGFLLRMRRIGRGLDREARGTAAEGGPGAGTKCRCAPAADRKQGGGTCG